MAGPSQSGLVSNGREVLGRGSYLQMRRTSTGGYLPTSAGHCTV